MVAAEHVEDSEVDVPSKLGEFPVTEQLSKGRMFKHHCSKSVPYILQSWT